jgi:SH3-like domain-containing protein
MSSQCNTLPDELWERVFDHLAPSTTTVRATAVCRTFRRILDDQGKNMAPIWLTLSGPDAAPRQYLRRRRALYLRVTAEDSDALIAAALQEAQAVCVFLDLCRDGVRLYTALEPLVPTLRSLEIWTVIRNASMYDELVRIVETAPVLRRVLAKFAPGVVTIVDHCHLMSMCESRGIDTCLHH